MKQKPFEQSQLKIIKDISTFIVVLLKSINFIMNFQFIELSKMLIQNSTMYQFIKKNSCKK